MKCKRSIALLALVVTMVLVPVALTQAKKPFRFEVSGNKTLTGWTATITSGPFEGYTMIWDNWAATFRRQNVYFFEEWKILNSTGIVVISGFDEGATRLKNGKFTGNGKVTYAIPAWGHLIGLKEHLDGARAQNRGFGLLLKSYSISHVPSSSSSFSGISP